MLFEILVWGHQPPGRSFRYLYFQFTICWCSKEPRDRQLKAYNDLEKSLLLTQSPTIQRVSHRLIICLAAIVQNNDTKLNLRDITQAYVQSNSTLNRNFYIRPPFELVAMLRADPSCILKVVQPLMVSPRPETIGSQLTTATTLTSWGWNSELTTLACSTNQTL